ncbi:DUF5134 domain-containing protein [Streptomyces sp. NPDC048277]|uniref:DUF5134 domain-containing protein n=1 Tax=Streptomyces sp. NPDC048277 TaxID=3155027 RepID=UPI00340A3A38
MSSADFVYCVLTVLFAAEAVRALRHALGSRSPGWRSRVDQLLHTAMALAMAVMPWNCGSGLPALPRTAFFTAAALWFPLTATFPLAAAGSRQRSRPTATARRLPYAVGMAAMAWMTLSMAGPSHAMVTGVLALYLLGYGLWSLTRGMPTLRGVSPAAAGSGGTTVPYGCFWDGTMALGTVIMLLMHP